MLSYCFGLCFAAFSEDSSDEFQETNYSKARRQTPEEKANLQILSEGVKKEVTLYIQEQLKAHTGKEIPAKKIFTEQKTIAAPLPHHSSFYGFADGREEYAQEAFEIQVVVEEESKDSESKTLEPIELTDFRFTSAKPF